MQRFYCALLLLSLVTAPAFSADKNKNKDKNPLPQALVAARHVCVTNLTGESESARLDAKDRKAIADVQNALRQWGHYEVTDHPEDADLIVAVRTRFTPEAGPAIVVSPNYSASRSSPEFFPAPFGRPAGSGSIDTLRVFDAKLGGVKSAPLWWLSQSEGLGKGLPLLKHFQKEVEAASKHP